jgi:DNA adenine methylase
MKMPRSLLRYPGGKLNAIKFIKPYWQQIQHSEFREPFVGGGSVFMQKSAVEKNWINDIDKNVVSFYKILADSQKLEELIDELLKLKISKKAYDEIFYSKPRDNYGKAKRFYILNRLSFSGITKWNSFIGDVRYNIKSAQHLMRKTGEKLSSYKITSYDFADVISAKSTEDNMFLFLDPPYTEAIHVSAYGKKFEKKDHERLAKLLKKSKFSFLVTYDNTQFIRELYDWAYQKDYTWKYTLQQTHNKERSMGEELFITNFEFKDKIQKKII